MIESTFAMVKSKAVTSPMLGTVMSRILMEGFAINRCRQVYLTSDQVNGLYGAHMNRPYYADLVRSVSGPVVIMELSAESSIQRWRNIMGATDSKKAEICTIRYLARDEPIMANNIVHGSDSEVGARHELRVMFGDVS